MLYFLYTFIYEILNDTSTQEKTSPNDFPDSKPSDWFKVEDDHMRCENPGYGPGQYPQAWPIFNEACFKFGSKIREGVLFIPRGVSIHSCRPLALGFCLDRHGDLCVSGGLLISHPPRVSLV